MTRLLRALAAIGLLTEKPEGFALTPAGTLLRTGTPDSMNEFVRMFTDPAILGAWQELDSSIRTGKPAFDSVFGTDFFSHLKTRPELSAQFNASMSQGTRLTAATLPSLYDFGRFRTLVDVGGGDGTLLAAILREHPNLRGILFDTPEGLKEAALPDQATTATGDFFTKVPEGGDLYLIKSVLHDWDDERCATILRNIRQVIPVEGRVLIIEPVFPELVDGSMPPPMYLSDLNMLVNLGGRERTASEFGELCQRAGFAVTGITPMPPPAAFSVIEAAPA